MERVCRVLRANDGVIARRVHSGAVIDALLARGLIRRVLPGVYVDIDLLADRRTRFRAALTGRPAAVLWGESAVSLITAHERPFGPREIIDIAQLHRCNVAGLRITRRWLDPTDVWNYHGIRCPRPAVVAVEAATRDAGRTADWVLREGLAGPAELTDALRLFDGSRGQQLRRAVIVSYADNPWSGGERRLHQLLRRSGVSGWVANVRLRLPGGDCYPDVLFDDARLVVEFDGYAVHSSAAAFEADRRRQNRLVLAGYRVLRFTWRRLQDDPEGVVGEIRATLAAPEPFIA